MTQSAPNTELPVNEQGITQDERLLALFAHLSIFFGSLKIPLIFWAINKGKSKFVVFHSLQSLFFHLAYSVVLGFIIGITAVTGFAAGIFKGAAHSHSPGAFAIIIFAALGIMIALIVLGAIVLAILNAVDSYKGGMKKYPVIGNIVYRKVYGK